MSGVQLLLSFLMVTLGWQLVARVAGPVLAQRFYRNKVAALQSAGSQFANQTAMKEWADKSSAHAMNMALLVLAAACGAIAGVLNFPLIGFSRSFNGWSWLRIIALCGMSWAIALTLHGSSY